MVRRLGTYQDILRAIGYDLDRSGFNHIILEESNREVAAFQLAPPEGVVRVHHYSESRIRRMVAEARARRGQGPRPDKQAYLSYEDRLRTIGYQLDEKGLRRVLIIESDGTFIVKESAREGTPKVLIYRTEDLREIQKKCEARRG